MATIVEPEAQREPGVKTAPPPRPVEGVAAAARPGGRKRFAFLIMGVALLGLVAPDARVGAARAARDQARLNLSYTRITAPASGVVSKKTVEVGQLVQAGQPLMSVVPLDDIWVTANLKETETADVTPGDPADFTVDAYPGRHFTG